MTNIPIACSLSPEALRATLQDIVFMATVGLHPVLVHGGGKPIDRAMEIAGIKPRKVLGRRYTDDATLNIVVKTLLQEINAGIVRQIRHLGGRARTPQLQRGAMDPRNGRLLDAQLRKQPRDG